MTGYRESDTGYIFSIGWPLDDGPIEMTPRQESNLIDLAEWLMSKPPESLDVPMYQKGLPRFAPYMQVAFQGREMPLAIATLVSRFGS